VSERALALLLLLLHRSLLLFTETN